MSNRPPLEQRVDRAEQDITAISDTVDGLTTRQAVLTVAMLVTITVLLHVTVRRKAASPCRINIWVCTGLTQ